MVKYGLWEGAAKKEEESQRDRDSDRQVSQAGSEISGATFLKEALCYKRVRQEVKKDVMHATQTNKHHTKPTSTKPTKHPPLQQLRWWWQFNHIEL